MNRYSGLKIPRGQCNNPSAAKAAEVAHEHRSLIPRVPRVVQVTLRREVKRVLQPHKAHK